MVRRVWIEWGLAGWRAVESDVGDPVARERVFRRTGFGWIERLAGETRAGVEVRRRLQLTPVVGAVDKLLAIPSQRVNRADCSRRSRDDDLGTAECCANDRVADRWIFSQRRAGEKEHQATDSEHHGHFRVGVSGYTCSI